VPGGASGQARYAGRMSPIPGEPLKPKAPELTTSDGRTFKLKLPGAGPAPEPPAAESEPPRDDPADPEHAES